MPIKSSQSDKRFIVGINVYGPATKHNTPVDSTPWFNKTVTIMSLFTICEQIYTGSDGSLAVIR